MSNNTDKLMSKRYTEGIMGDGAVVLCDGVMLPVHVLVQHLNNLDGEITEFERVPDMQGYYISSNAPSSGKFIKVSNEQ